MIREGSEVRVKENVSIKFGGRVGTVFNVDSTKLLSIGIKFDGGLYYFSPDEIEEA